MEIKDRQVQMELWGQADLGATLDLLGQLALLVLLVLLVRQVL